MRLTHAIAACAAATMLLTACGEESGAEPTADAPVSEVAAPTTSTAPADAEAPAAPETEADPAETAADPAETTAAPADDEMVGTGTATILVDGEPLEGLDFFYCGSNVHLEDPLGLYIATQQNSDAEITLGGEPVEGHVSIDVGYLESGEMANFNLNLPDFTIIYVEALDPEATLAGSYDGESAWTFNFTGAEVGPAGDVPIHTVTGEVDCTPIGG